MKFDNSFFYDSKFLNLNKNKTYLKYQKKCLLKAYIIKDEFKNGSNEILNSFKPSYQTKIESLRKKINLNKNKKTVIIGMGGSSAGAKAIASYLNEKIIFFDNLDYNFFFDFIKTNNIFNYNYFIISKSGDTFETLAILNLLVKNIYNKKKNYPLKKLIFIISDLKDSYLANFASNHNLHLIEHNPNIGGRFSAFSETALLPIKKTNFIIYKNSKFLTNIINNIKHNLSPALNASLILYLWKKKKITTYVNLIYDYRFKHFSYWFHQLHAESLGKNSKGLLPYTSICPKDHHSMMQLFLDGPKDKFFNIIKPRKKNYGLFKCLGFKNIENYNTTSLVHKQCNAVIECFKKNKIPHRVIEFKNDMAPENIFNILSYFMLETLILGYASGINPYDQPAVQQIKNKISNSLILEKK